MLGLRCLQEGKGDQGHVVYCCSTCGCVLQVRRDTEPPDKGAGLLFWRCAGCGRHLEGGIERRLAESAPKWSGVTAGTPAPAWEARPLFQRASSIPHFCLGFPKLDSLLRPLSTGDLVLLSGSPSSVVAELAAFRAQLPIEEGGLDSGVIYIDGGNRSDPYLFSSFAKQKNLEPAVAMKRVASCRVFTLYQLAATVSEHLVRTIEDYGAKLVIIADILGTFNEPELEEREARRVLAAIEEGIQAVKKHALVISTLVSPNKYDDIIMAWPDTSVHLSSEADDVEAQLVGQRGRPPRTTIFKHSRLLRAVRTGGTR